MVLDEAGRVILFNRAAEALTGCESATVMARRPSDVWAPPEGAAPCETIITELIRHGGTGRCTLGGHAKAGDQRAVDWQFTAPAAPERGSAADVSMMILIVLEPRQIASFSRLFRS